MLVYRGAVAMDYPILRQLIAELVSIGDAVTLAEIRGQLETLQKDVTAMSGTVSDIDTIIKQLQSDEAAESAVVKSLVTFVGTIPQMIADAVAAAGTSQPLTDAQKQAFSDLDASIKADASALTGALPTATPPPPAPAARTLP